MDEATKKIVIDLIKSIDIKEMIIPEEAHRKWFRFGAYDFARMLSEKVMEHK